MFFIIGIKLLEILQFCILYYFVISAIDIVFIIMFIFLGVICFFKGNILYFYTNINICINEIKICINNKNIKKARKLISNLAKIKIFNFFLKIFII